MLSDKNLLLEPYVHGIYDPDVLPSGAHCCALTESMDQRKQIAKEFILKGLRSKKLFLYRRNDSTKDQIMSLLQEDLTHPESYLKSGQLQIVSFDEIFFENGQFNLAKRDSLMHELIESTKREGYSAIRAIGEMGWAAKNPIYLENLIKWEVIINQKFRDNPAFIGHCQYNIQDFSPSFLNRILEIHPVCQIGN
ncbi:MAG: MEDS domain-containing protein, partial [Candidatus Nucleicultricaceae bacterium]